MNKNDLKERDGEREGTIGTIRLVLEYKENDVNLISQQQVDMIPPPSDALEYSERETGFWFVVKDKEKRVLYRRIIQNPIKYAVEVRSDDPDRPLAWETVKEPQGVFVLMLPAFDEAATVSLFSSPFTLEDSMRPAKEFASISLKRGR